jgi:hypothetical protein
VVSWGCGGGLFSIIIIVLGVNDLLLVFIVYRFRPHRNSSFSGH